MDKPTQEQIKEFWEWCGIRYESDQDVFKVIFPDEQPWYNFGHNWKMDKMEPPIDLNNLFKYAVPNVRGIIPKLDLLTHWVVIIVRNGEDPALALFWALYQVMEATNGR